MRAHYDTVADAIQVFIPLDWKNRGGTNEILGDGVLVDIDRDGVPMGMAVMEPGAVDLTHAVPEAARRFGLDADAILAAMRAALAAPDRVIMIDVQELSA
jgi:uncharacterized protein YuzE